MHVRAENIKNILLKYWPLGTSLYLSAAILCLLLDTLFPLIAITSLILILLIIWQPLIGFCIMVFFMPLEDLSIISSSFTFIKLTGIITFWCWLMHLFIGKKPVKMNSFFFILILYTLWGLFSATWAIEPEQSLRRIISLGQLLIMFFLGYNLVDNKRSAYFILGSYLLGTFIASCLGIYSGYLYGFTTRIDLGGLHNQNFYARLLGLGLIFNIYFIFIFKKTLPRLLNIISFPIVIFAILLTGSRGTWVALFSALIVGLILSVKYFIKFINKRNILISMLVILIFTLAVGPFVFNHLPPMITQRVQTFTHISDHIDRGSGRFDIWLVGLEIVKDNLIKGVGLNNFPYAFTEYFAQTEGIVRYVGLNRDAHNNFLTNLAELGIPGFLLFICLLFSMWQLGGRTENPADSILCKLITVFLVVAGFTNTDHFSKFFWLGMLIPGILAQFGILRGLQHEKDKTRVLFLSPIFPNQYNPNYGIFSFQLVQNLKDAGISVNVVAPVPYAPPYLRFKEKWKTVGRIPLKEYIDGVEIIHPRYFCLPGERFKEWNMLFMYWAIYPSVEILNSKASFNVMHSYGVLPTGFVGLLIARKLKLPSVCTAIGSDINVNAQRSKKMTSRAQYVLETTGQVVSVGKDLALAANKLHASNKDIKVIHEGVDSDMFDTTGMDPVQAKIKIGFKPNNRIILFVGRLLRDKGIYELIAAFAAISQKFPEAALAIVGTGAEKEPLVALADQKGLQEKITFAGPVPHKELVWWYAASEIVTLLSYHEGVPNVIKEAMSCSRPVVATRTVGIPELVVDGETGILVEPGNVDEAAAALKKLLSDPQLGREMGLRAGELIREVWLDWKETAKAYRKVYYQLTRK